MGSCQVRPRWETGEALRDAAGPPHEMRQAPELVQGGDGARPGRGGARPGCDGARPGRGLPRVRRADSSLPGSSNLSGVLGSVSLHLIARAGTEGRRSPVVRREPSAICLRPSGVPLVVGCGFHGRDRNCFEIRTIGRAAKCGAGRLLLPRLQRNVKFGPWHMWIAGPFELRNIFESWTGGLWMSPL